MQDDRILVLAARSLIGGFLLPRLVRAGARPLALSRGTPADGGEAITWVQGDLTSSDDLARVPPFSTVISLCPIWVLADAVPTLIEGGARRIVAFSSTSRYTKAASPDSGERAVAARLADGERRAAEACTAASVRCTILRPTLIYAEGQDGNVTRLASLIRRLGVLPLAGNGDGLRQPVHADDLAAVAMAAMSADPPDPAYDLPGGETLTYRQMAARIFEGLGRTPCIVSLPKPLWQLGFALASPFLRGATAQMGARMEADLTFDPEPARRDLGWSPRAFHPDFSGQP